MIGLCSACNSLRGWFATWVGNSCPTIANRSPCTGQELYDERRTRYIPFVSRDQAYQRLAMAIDKSEPLGRGTFPLIGLANYASTPPNPTFLNVSRLERFTENGRRFIKLGLESNTVFPPMNRTLRMTIAADNFTVVRDEPLKGDGWRTEAVYESTGGIPLLKQTRSSGPSNDGTETAAVFTVLDRKLGPVPDDEFTPERLLGDTPVHRVSQEADAIRVSPLLTWFWLPLVLGAVSLAAGAALELLARRSPKAL